MQALTPAVATELREAMALARSGGIAAARTRAEIALRASGGHGAVHAFLGMLCCQSGDFPTGIDHLRSALRANPHDITIAANLTAALVETGAFEEATKICTEARAESDPSLRLWRLRAYALQQDEDHEGAAAAYARIVARAPGDWEALNNLGNALSASGRLDEAVDALARAAELAPDSGPIHLNLAGALFQAGRLEAAGDVLGRFSQLHPHDPKPLIELSVLRRYQYRDPEALEALEQAVTVSPPDPELLVELGEGRMAALQFGSAERAFRQALSIQPDHADAHIRLALLLENINREDEMRSALKEAERAGVERGAVQFIRALVCRRESAFEQGLAALREVPADLKAILRAQLEGQFRDRLGDAEGAFAAFSEMNRLFKLDPSQPERRAEAYRAALRMDKETVTPAWFAAWKRASPPDCRAAPAFLVGFPRSGTTLLDTMLMGHPDAQVLEERPPLKLVEDKLGGIAKLPHLSCDAIEALRGAYFDAVARDIDLRDGSLLVDKSPLHMNQLPLIHRLWPDARIVLALRHPCDVVLSCFMTAFRLNDAMANFIDLNAAADFYDLSFAHWRNCAAIMPVQVHTVRYEDLVADGETEMRRLVDFLGLEWDASVMEHQITARSRGLISTASYAQVTEGVYRRAAGRWERYRRHLQPVLPMLKPWAEHHGYAV